MDAHLTTGTDTVDVDQADPEAPYGRRPDGTAYKRDPEQMRRIREARGSSSGRARKTGAAPRPASPRGTTAAAKPAAKKTQVRYGAGIARAIVSGSNLLLQDPVERAIMRHQGAQLAVIVDRLLEEDPRLLQWAERIRSKWTGGAKGELAAWTVATGGMVAVQRGYRHPLMVLAFGGVIEQCQAEAILHEQQQAEDRAAMAVLMEQYEREQREYVAQATAAMAADERPPSPSPFSAFAEARGP